MDNSIFFLIGKENSLRAKRLEKGYTQSIPRYKEAKNKRINKSDSYLVASQSTKSIKERVCSSIYTLAQFTKVYKKNGFNILVISLNIIEDSPIPFFPNGLYQAEGASSPSFLPFLAHKRSMPTQEVSFHRGVHHPMHPKKGED